MPASLSKKNSWRNLNAAGHQVVDFGARSLNPDDDYPDFVVPLAEAVVSGKVDRGVAICGSGVGASVCVNKVPGVGEDFDATGHSSRSVFDEVGVPREADVYLCGPTRFMAEMKEALATLGFAVERIHVELFNGSEPMPPGVVGGPTPERWYRSRAVASPHTGMRRPTGAFWSWPRRATSRSVGRAGPVFVTAVRAG